MKSEAFNNATVFSLTISIFLLSDYFIEALLSKKQNRTLLSIVNVTYVILVFLVDSVIFFYAVPANNFILVICCGYIRFILAVCAGSVSLAVFGGNFWHGYLAYGYVLLMSAGLVLKALLLSFPYWSHWLLAVSCRISVWGAALLHFTLCYFWFRFIIKVSRSSGMTLDHYCGCMYAFGWFFLIIFSLTKSLTYFPTGVEDYNESWLVSYMYGLAVLTMLCLLF
jgi:hypothetical protein